MFSEGIFEKQSSRDSIVDVKYTVQSPVIKFYNRL